MTQATTDPTVDAVRPQWLGLNHLALVTTDMDATVRFWHGVLGAELVATVGTPNFKHYFFKVGDAQTIAFFEYTGVELDTYAKPAGIPYRQASQFDHLSIGLPDEQALEDLRSRLQAHGCEVTEVVDHGFIRSVYFSDPTGIALEASWWTSDIDGDGGAGPFRDPDRFLDDDPVPALRELQDSGRLAETPRTTLVDDLEIRPGVEGL